MYTYRKLEPCMYTLHPERQCICTEMNATHTNQPLSLSKREMSIVQLPALSRCHTNTACTL